MVSYLAQVLLRPCYVYSFSADVVIHEILEVTLFSSELGLRQTAFSFSHDLNKDYHYDAKEDDHQVLKRKVIRGGSWKDISYFIQTSTRSYEYQDTAKSYIGFRCVKTYAGVETIDFGY